MSILFPEYMIAINKKISICRNTPNCYREVLYLLDDVVFFRHLDEDKESFRFIIYQLIINDLATPTEIHKTLYITRASIYNWIKRYSFEEDNLTRHKIFETYLERHDLIRLQKLFDKCISIQDIEYLQGIDVELINMAIWEGNIIEDKELKKKSIQVENKVKQKNKYKIINSSASPKKKVVKLYL